MLVVSATTIAECDEGMPPVLKKRAGVNLRSNGQRRKGLRNCATNAPANAAIIALLASRISMGSL
jgi:hypothetical protein